MGEYQALIQTLALTLGTAWASGINLYAVVAALGIGGALGYVELPAELQVVQDPLVILVASIMFCVEFMADKTPGVDTGWDALHTFIRIPGGALLAAGAVGDVQPALAVAAGLTGGAVTAVTHAAKAGTRVMINTSPEPFSNWAASLAEDIAVLAGIWAALKHPLLFLIALALFLLALIWVLPRIWKGVMRVGRKIGGWLGLVNSSSTGQLGELQRLLDNGVLTEAEFEAAKARLTSP